MSKFLITAVCIIMVIVSMQFTQAPQQDLKVKLGEALFFDPILSIDSSVSCASCHKPEFAFADTVALSKGVGGKVGTRNTPTVMNMLARPYFFYDGRSPTLEHQVMGPIENPVEMALDYEHAIDRVGASELYSQTFELVYSQEVDSIVLLDAIAAFMRTLESDGSSDFDLYMKGDEEAITASQKRGHQLFLGKAKCFDCHFSPDFTADEFRNIGLYDEKTYTDKGRFLITGDSTDLGRFKTSGLRNIAVTAPYMHDGSFETLEEVIEYYDNPYEFVENPINIDTLLREPLGLTEQEKTDLVNFLHSLTDAQFQ